EVDDGLEVDARERGCGCFAVGEIGLDDLDPALRQLLDPAHGLGAAVREIVEHDDPVPALEQHQGGVGTDVSGAAGQQYTHAPRLLGRTCGRPPEGPEGHILVTATPDAQLAHESPGFSPGALK